jgi:SMI1 / KNR4 family (SUKH-1)
MKASDIHYTSRRKASRDEISEIESLLRIQLPSDYVEFMLTFGGGSLQPCPHFMLLELDAEHWITNFVHINENGASPSSDAEVGSLSWLRHRYEAEFQVALAEWLPIAETGTDCLVLLKIRGSTQGRVGFAYIDDEVGYDDEPLEAINVSPTFSEFLDSLYLDSKRY